MSNRLLIISDAFNRPLYVPRITSLCKYLTRKGWEITILTEKLDSEDFQVPNTKFLAMPYYFGNKLRRHLQWFCDKLWQRKDKCLFNYAQKQLDINQFDCILCSSFNVFPIQASFKIAKKAHKPLVIDLRDIAEQWGGASYMVNSMKSWKFIGKHLTSCYIDRTTKQRNKMLQQANAITTISSWHKNFLCQYNPQTQLIYNGYDPELYDHKAIKTTEFIISYIGRIYDLQSRDPKLLLQALSEIKQENQLPNNIKLIFHIEDAFISTLQDLTKEYNLYEISNINGYIPRVEAIKLLERSGISVVLNENPDTCKVEGVMTTKFYESLGCEKPVLCIPSDNGELAQTIRKTNAGLASSDVNEIKSFILEKYQEWKANGYTHQNVIGKEAFSRQKQAEQFDQLFIQCINEWKK